MATTIVPVGRLHVIGTVLETYDMLAKHFVRGILHYILVLLIFLALSVVLFHIVGMPVVRPGATTVPEGMLQFYLLMLAICLPEVVFFVGMFRLGVHGSADRNHLLGLRWGKRETCVLLRTIWVTVILELILVVLAIPVVLIVAFAFGRNFAPPEPQSLGFLAVTYAVVVFPFGYLFCRFFLYCCAPALDERLSLGQAWQITRGNGWRILIVTVLLQLPIAVVNMVLTYGLQLEGTMIGALAQGGITIIGLMFAGFGSAIIYRAFVPTVAAQTPGAPAT